MSHDDAALALFDERHYCDTLFFRDMRHADAIFAFFTPIDTPCRHLSAGFSPFSPLMLMMIRHPPLRHTDEVVSHAAIICRVIDAFITLLRHCLRPLLPMISHLRPRQIRHCRCRCHSAIFTLLMLSPAMRCCHY